MPPKRKAAEVSGEKSKSLAPQPKKSKFAVTPKYFTEKAYSLNATLSGQSELAKLECKPRKFGSNSLGWSGNTRIKVPVQIKDGEYQEMDAQVSLNITLLGSKEATSASGEDKEEPNGKPEASEAQEVSEAKD